MNQPPERSDRRTTPQGRGARCAPPILPPGYSGGLPPRRGRWLAFGAALVTLVVLGFVVFFDSQPRHASADPVIQLDISATGGVNDPACTPDAKCTFTSGSKINLLIKAPIGKIPPFGYTGYEAVIDFSGAVNLNQSAINPPFSKWADCHVLTQDLTGLVLTPPRYRVSCKTGIFPPTVVTYTGPLVNVSFQCKTGQGTIRLVGGAPNSRYISADTQHPNGFNWWVAADETLTINCNAATNTPTRTFTPTSAATKGATPACTAGWVSQSSMPSLRWSAPS